MAGQGVDSVVPGGPSPGTVVIDIVENAIWRETKGRIVEIQRLAIVSNLPVPQDPVPLDKLLAIALDAGVTIPQPGDPHPHESNLRVVQRDPKPRGVGIVEVLITYKLPEGGENVPPQGQQFVLSGGSAVEQITTQLRRPPPIDDGSQITVEHNGVEQGGEITPFESRSELSLTRVENTANPLGISRFWTNTVNIGGWLHDPGAPPRTWLIAEVGFELISPDLPIPEWRFSYRLRNNPDGFDPQVIFIDPETGRPPPGLVQGTGYKTILWHAAFDFGNVFGQ